MKAEPHVESGSARVRVLQCITRLGLGGAEQVAFTLIRSLRHEFDFAVFTVHGASEDAVGAAMRQELENARLPWYRGTRIPMKLGGMVPGGLALAGAVRDFRPDIVHLHSETPEACGAIFAGLGDHQSKPAIVRTIHNSVFWRYWPRIGNWCDRRLHHALVACVSEGARAEFNRYRENSGAPPPAFPPDVIYNGVDLPFRAPSDSRPEKRIRVLFAGRFELQKGVDLLCDALPKVTLPPATMGELTLIGDGVLTGQAYGLAAHPPPGWRVEVRPPVADLSAILAEFDLVVMPSRFEGLGLVAIEATIRGLPIVAANAPGLNETLPADYPWWVRPQDTAALAEGLSRAMADSHRWGSVVRQAQEFVRQRFGVEAMRQAYAGLYHHAVNAAPFGETRRDG